MLTFYESQGFKLFPCNVDKSPRVSSWRSTNAHITKEQAERFMETGVYIGAWLPEKYVVIDIDMGHKEGQDGMSSFLSLCDSLGLSSDSILSDTLVIKTGSGGFHLYFQLPDEVSYKEISQKSLTDSVDVRTHLGYVIASGTGGYSIHNKAKPIMLPAPFVELMKRKSTEKATTYSPAKELPVKVLEKLLNKIPAEEFNNNDDWQEFVTSCIAVSGNSPEALDIIETWSKSDPSYTEDLTIRKRLETFEPEGGITAGTFLHTIKSKGISKYMYNKVRMLVGTEFNFTSDFTENFDLPFKPDFSQVAENLELMRSFYYRRHQTSGVEMFTKLVKGNLYYIEKEKRFYYYNGNLWVEAIGVLKVIFTVLLQAGMVYFTDFSDGKDDDSKELINEYIDFLGALSIQQKFESAIKQHPSVAHDSMLWDGPELESTLTLIDCVMDFTGKEIVFRKGLREEHRRRSIDLKEEDFREHDSPVKFKEFLKDVFPDMETRKMATYALSTMLSGTGKFRKFQIWNGSGNNGKSALMNIMEAVIGDRAARYTPHVLLSSDRRESLTPEVADLRGALVAFSSETDEAKRVSEGAIKNLTGNEMISANPKYQGMIKFQTTFQLVLATNFLPDFSAHDTAFVNRILIIPFLTCFYDTEEQKEGGQRRGSQYFKPAGDGDKIKEEVVAERAKILYYLASRYQELDHTIPESKESLRAKEHYIKDNNSVMEMLYEMIEFDATKDWFTPSKDLTEYYNEEQNTKASSKRVVKWVKEVHPLAENGSKRIHGKVTRGLKHIRLVYGAYPEGYTGNFTPEEISQYVDADKEEF